MADHDSDKQEAGQPKRIRYHYLKSGFFRTIHSDGVYGGVTPHGNIHIAFYSERIPIPQQIEHVVKEDGTLGDEDRAARITREGVVREVDVDVVVSLGLAIALRKWLDDKIKTLEDTIAKTEKPMQ